MIILYYFSMSYFFTISYLYYHSCYNGLALHKNIYCNEQIYYKCILCIGMFTLYLDSVRYFSILLQLSKLFLMLGDTLVNNYLCIKFFSFWNAWIVLRPWIDVVTKLKTGDRETFSILFKSLIPTLFGPRR